MAIEIGDREYYNREKEQKEKKVLVVRDFIMTHDDINFIFDVGCNNGAVSYPLQKEFGKKVYGVDLSHDMELPSDYHFKRDDLVTSGDVVINDCTLFLSVYHHLLGAYGLGVADECFGRLLSRTKYLVFDSGNISEMNRVHKYWYIEQKKHFRTEAELLDHFNVGYDVLGSWRAGGGIRSVVVFRNGLC
jgi:SAM-dependent methyltransferase